MRAPAADDGAVPSRPKLSRALLDPHYGFPDGRVVLPWAPMPERVLQFGEGNFLRAFVDWMLHRMNERGLFTGSAVLVQPIAKGMTEALNAQQGLYTVLLRGLEGGALHESHELVQSVSRSIDPYADYDAFLACAKNPDLRFVVSNTTEAGIRTDPSDRLDARPATSFPGKLTQLLYARFRHFDGDPERGLVMLPCELIEKNGVALERAVRATAEAFRLPRDFGRFLSDACVFTSTLVDRIVTGYPHAEAAELAERLGYEDSLLVVGETFHSWVIERHRPIEAELPLREAGLHVVFTDDVGPYRERKVRILNGAHTMTALAAHLAGKETVRDCMEDPLFAAFVERGIRDEIVPTLKLPREEVLAFAEAVMERFQNPFLKHAVLDIALNSVSKYKARILETVRDHFRQRGVLPPRLVFALAALIVFYRGREMKDGALVGDRDGAAYLIRDEPPVLEFFRDAWASEKADDSAFYAELSRRVLARSDFWGEDLNGTLPGLAERVAAYVQAIRRDGVRRALEAVTD
jgi:tagaturonate reductase